MLSPTRYEERLRNIMPIASKVFDAVPISEPWSSTDIQSEMSRLGTRPGGTDILMGCLNSLKQAGPAFFTAARAGQITPEYRIALQALLGDDWKAAHEEVKAEHDRLQSLKKGG